MTTKIEAKLTKIPGATDLVLGHVHPSSPPVPKAGKGLNRLVIDAKGGLWLTSDDVGEDGLPIAPADAAEWAGWVLDTVDTSPEWEHEGGTGVFFKQIARLLRDGGPRKATEIVYLPQEFLARAEKRAKELGVDFSEYVCRLAEADLERNRGTAKAG